MWFAPSHYIRPWFLGRPLSLSLSLSLSLCGYMHNKYISLSITTTKLRDLNQLCIFIAAAERRGVWLEYIFALLPQLFIHRSIWWCRGRSVDGSISILPLSILPSFLPYFPSWSFVPLRPKFSFPSFSHPHAKCGRRTSQDGSPRRQTNHHNRPSQRGDTAAVEAGRVGRRRRRHWRPRQNGHECVKRRGRRRRS